MMNQIDATLSPKWKGWWKQVRAILSLEVRKALRGRRFLGAFVLAAAPVFLFSLRFLVQVTGMPDDAVRSLGGLTVIYALIYRTFILRLVIFFGSVVIFTSLFRGEVLENTLHYYFLSPVRREVLAVGKFFSGVLIAFALYGSSTILSFLLLYLPQGQEATEYFSTGSGLWHLSAYLGVTFLACLGYGAVFLLMGLTFRNPIIPAAVVLGWETINFLLPPSLKQISVIYYLESLCPVAIPTGPFTILADPAPLWLAIPSLLGVTALVLFLAGLQLRRLEINYSSD